MTARFVAPAALSCLLVVLCAAPAPAAQKKGSSQPYLSRPQAEIDADLLLGGSSEFGWRSRVEGAVRCRQRINRHHLRCKVSWAVGDAAFAGYLHIWYDRLFPGPDFFAMSYRIVMLDDYCLEVQHRPVRRCMRVYRAN